MRYWARPWGTRGRVAHRAVRRAPCAVRAVAPLHGESGLGQLSFEELDGIGDHAPTRVHDVFAPSLSQGSGAKVTAVKVTYLYCNEGRLEVGYTSSYVATTAKNLRLLQRSSPSQGGFYQLP